MEGNGGNAPEIEIIEILDDDAQPKTPAYIYIDTDDDDAAATSRSVVEATLCRIGRRSGANTASAEEGDAQHISSVPIPDAVQAPCASADSARDGLEVDRTKGVDDVVSPVELAGHPSSALLTGKASPIPGQKSAEDMEEWPCVNLSTILRRAPVEGEEEVEGRDGESGRRSPLRPMGTGPPLRLQHALRRSLGSLPGRYPPLPDAKEICDEVTRRTVGECRRRRKECKAAQKQGEGGGADLNQQYVGRRRRMEAKRYPQPGWRAQSKKRRLTRSGESDVSENEAEEEESNQEERELVAQTKVKAKSARERLTRATIRADKDNKDEFSIVVLHHQDPKDRTCAFCGEGNDLSRFDRSIRDMFLHASKEALREGANSELEDKLDLNPGVWLSKVPLVTQRGQGSTLKRTFAKEAVYVHRLCAMLTPGTRIDFDNGCFGVREALNDSRQAKCSVCGQMGATFSCGATANSCSVKCHLFCAIEHHGWVPSDVGIDVNRFVCRPHREHDFQTILSQAAEDISGGNENVQVTAVNAVDSRPPPLDFWYIGHNVMSEGVIMRGGRLDNRYACTCENSCSGKLKMARNKKGDEGRRRLQDWIAKLGDDPCECYVKTGGAIYDNVGLLRSPFPPAILLECGVECMCHAKKCHNRVVGRGMTVTFELFRLADEAAAEYEGTEESKQSGPPPGAEPDFSVEGWGVRVTEFVKAGTFLCEFRGQFVAYGKVEEALKSGDRRVARIRDWVFADDPPIKVSGPRRRTALVVAGTDSDGEENEEDMLSSPLLPRIADTPGAHGSCNRSSPAQLSAPQASSAPGAAAFPPSTAVSDTGAGHQPCTVYDASAIDETDAHALAAEGCGAEVQQQAPPSPPLPPPPASADGGLEVMEVVNGSEGVRRSGVMEDAVTGANGTGASDVDAPDSDSSPCSVPVPEVPSTSASAFAPIKATQSPLASMLLPLSAKLDEVVKEDDEARPSTGGFHRTSVRAAAKLARKAMKQKPSVHSAPSCEPSSAAAAKKAHGNEEEEEDKVVSHKERMAAAALRLVKYDYHDLKGDVEVMQAVGDMCLDARWYGSISRFIRTAKDVGGRAVPNVVRQAVFSKMQDPSMPQLAIFAARDLKPGTELLLGNAVHDMN